MLEQLAGKKIMVGCIDLDDIDTSRRPRRSPRASGARCPTCAAEDVILAPDCGMKYLPREVAFGKMRAMVEAAKMLRAEFAS